MNPAVPSPSFVLVGVDGSPNADTALDLACDEALRRGIGLHVVHAVNLVGVMAVALIAAGSTENDDVLTRAEERVRARASSLTVTTKVCLASAQDGLVEESANAALVVVGARGETGVVATLLGSVATHVASRAHCPVLVVPLLPVGLDGHQTPHVVVGYDDSPESDTALLVGAREAQLLAAELHIVMAWSLETIDGMVVTTVGSPQWLELERYQHRRLDLAVVRLHAAAPEVADVSIRIDIVHGRAVEVLLTRSRSAHVLVVGSRGRGGLHSILLGSVSRTLLERSHRPVMVTTRRTQHIRAGAGAVTTVHDPEASLAPVASGSARAANPGQPS